MSALLRPVLREHVWRIVPESTPRVLRHCAGCGGARAFASSDRFRVNANGRRVDVWLIYRCVICDRTWNRAVYERVGVAELGGAIDALSANDPALARRCAFRVDDLAALGARLDGDVPFRVERDEIAVTGPTRVRLAVAYPCPPRLDRVLARALDTSRSAILRWARAGLIDADARALRRAVRDDQVVCMRID